MPLTEKQKVIGGAIIVVCVGIVILGLLSFSYVEYYQYGFLRKRSAGTVFTDKIYTTGRYFLGPDQDFLIYKADAHYVTLDAIQVFTQDKLEVDITVHMQYFLRKDQLVEIHKEFNVYYEDVVFTSAVDAIKGSITVYTTRELINNRTDVEVDLYNAVRQRIGGTCCRPDCNEFKHACPPGCLAADTCEDKNKGLHIDVRYFQLTKINIPDDVETRFMEALVLQETTLREKLFQSAQVIRKETQQQVKEIENEAYEISQNATARADLVGILADADYIRSIERARIIGLKQFYEDLNVTSEEHKISINYVKSLLSNENVQLTVGYDQRIAGTFTQP